MLGRAVFSVALAWMAALALQACTTKSCTEIGCFDGAAISIRTPNDYWPDGAYAIDFTIDGESHSCAMLLPQPKAATTQLECDSELDVQLIPVAECVELSTPDAESQTCTLIDDSWLVQASIRDDTPSSLRVQIQRDGELLLDESNELSYSEFFPNGPECGPGCQQATLELTLR